MILSALLSENPRGDITFYVTIFSINFPPMIGLIKQRLGKAALTVVMATASVSVSINLWLNFSDQVEISFFVNREKIC